MTLLRKIKKLFTKEDYDFDSPDVNLRNFHPQLYIYLAAMGIFTNNRDSRLRFILPTVYISFTFIGVAFESIGLFHGVIVQDYAFATESFFYFLFLLMDLTVVCSVLYNKDEILQLLEDMNNDFIFIRTMESKHRDTFMAGQLFIHKLCCTWHLVPIIIDSLYISLMLCPLVIQGLFNTDSDVNRPLMFPLWLPADDPYRTPNYEIFVVLEIGFLMVATLLFGGYIYLLFHVLLHYYYILDMIIQDFEVIFNGLDESVACLLPKDPLRKQVQSTLNSRMKRIVNWHLAVFKSLKTVSSVFGPPIIYQSLEQGKLDIIFVMLLLASFVQVWIPCYIGTLLRDKGFAVGDACWNSGWHETRLGTLIRTDMVLVMQHSQKPLVIKFIGLPQLQLETFSSIMTTAYSYFNMLRQYNSDS
ncbi:odorant receptor 30a-like isoform X2 [Galleria mellonella]|uniref:Odorant receptor n=1 Tax=Galleria mellonella TaxID=7137 RepID=A0A6J3CAZ4_GALME|nr:odorant receptor 30a-like isoform X2 [Galleria mellonella]